MNPNFRTGAVTGTGAALTIGGELIGFRPKKVRIFSTSRVQLEWQADMADASGLKTAANGTRTIVTSNGITPTSSGFIIGTDSTNGSGETLYFEAWG